MPVETTVDECGEEMLRRKTPGGVNIFILFHEETVDSLPTMSLRSDDVLQCSYPKSGCHWTWEMIKLMLMGVDSYKDKRHKENYMVENCTMEDLTNQPSPRILNTHLPFSQQPKEVFEKGTKVVYVYRNIKDIAVSYFHHIKVFKDFTKYNPATFQNFLKRFAAGLTDFGNVFEYMKGWDEGIKKLGSQVLVLCYEDLKKDVMAELRRLSDFLEVDLDDKTMKQIADLTEFNTMRSRKKEDANSLLVDEQGNHMMYRKGQVGDWKNYFTVAESEWFDRLIKERLGDLTYHKFVYEL